jgi:hypothetical protein
MIDLIIGLAMFFLVPFFLLPCFVIIAMSLRGMTHTYQNHKPAGLENRRARHLTELAAINTSRRYSSLDVPSIDRGEVVQRSPAHLTPLQST